MVTCDMKVALSPSGSLMSLRSLAFSASLYPASPEFRGGPRRVRHQSSSLFVSPLELTLTRRVHSCPDFHEIKPLESIANLLSPLESTLTKCEDFKLHRIILLQKRGRGADRAPVTN